mmetsp:Transcript_28763/g.38358  ORF Transcript_28763/g.38358 Transcript_28763/m.38358 type:complete len:115 (+) Transcript_28763:1685-2029(+)
MATNELFVHFDELKLVLFERLVTSLHQVVALLAGYRGKLRRRQLVGQLFLLSDHFFEFAEKLLVASRIDLLLQRGHSLLQLQDRRTLLPVQVSKRSEGEFLLLDRPLQQIVLSS